jgi:hypothetical protein
VRNAPFAVADDVIADDVIADEGTADDAAAVVAAVDTDGLAADGLAADGLATTGFVAAVDCDDALSLPPASHADTATSATLAVQATTAARRKPRSKRMSWPFVGGVDRRLSSPTRGCQLLDVRQRGFVDARAGED